jgi:hypothetical protein
VVGGFELDFFNLMFFNFNFNKNFQIQDFLGPIDKLGLVLCQDTLLNV